VNSPSFGDKVVEKRTKKPWLLLSRSEATILSPVVSERRDTECVAGEETQSRYVASKSSRPADKQGWMDAGARRWALKEVALKDKKAGTEG
jgi:hypothetical protein